MTAASTTAETRTILNAESVPRLPPHVKLQYNEPRKQWVILAPERLLVPDETSVTILKICDGKTNIAAIIDHLASQYNAPRETIETDVMAMLQDLADKGFLLTTPATE